jgi:hypothetical protein
MQLDLGDRIGTGLSNVQRVRSLISFLQNELFNAFFLRRDTSKHLLYYMQTFHVRGGGRRGASIPRIQNGFSLGMRKSRGNILAALSSTSSSLSLSPQSARIIGFH